MIVDDDEMGGTIKKFSSKPPVNTQGTVKVKIFVKDTTEPATPEDK